MIGIALLGVAVSFAAPTATEITNLTKVYEIIIKKSPARSHVMFFFCCSMFSLSAPFMFMLIPMKISMIVASGAAKNNNPPEIICRILIKLPDGSVPTVVKGELFGLYASSS